MKFLFGILLISAFLVKDIASFSWDVWFYVNQKEIAAEKCENKAKPTLHCDGKCYLAKQLKKLDEKEQSHNSKRNPFYKIEKVELAQNFIFLELNKSFPSEGEKLHFFYQENYSSQSLDEIFHPPSI